ncbi:MAG: acetylglutamate kinase [Candidatus Pelagibacterales bacterium]|nr:MAG: acetylglutamate kinase [Pelagibacterales bacterium]
MLSYESIQLELNKIFDKDNFSVEEVKKNLKKYNNEFIVIKCGGSVLIDPNLFNIFIQDISILKKLGLSPIIVHGGGKRINNKLNKLNIKSNFIKGLRVTDIKTINIVEDVLIEFNKEIVNALQKKSCKAKRITSKEYNIISVKPENKELGFVGMPTKVKTEFLKEIINANEIPVIAPLGLDENNQTYNINADTAAGAVAKELKARRLLMISDVEGVLDQDKKLIAEINSLKAKNMINKDIISGGMIPKINNCIDVASNGVKGVVIIDGRKNHSILLELLSEKGAGTLIRE